MITEKMLAEAAAELSDAMLRSLPDPTECRHQFSPEFERKMKRVIRRANHPVSYRMMQRAASFIIVLFLSFMTLLAASPAVRAAVFGWIREQYKSFTQYSYIGSVEENNDSYDYILTYLPDGYEELDRIELPASTTIYFVNRKTNKSMYLIYSKNQERVNYYLKSEKYVVTQITIDGKRGEFYQSKDIASANALLWSDEETDTFFNVSAFLDKSELTKIAEKIIKKKS